MGKKKKSLRIYKQTAFLDRKRQNASQVGVKYRDQSCICSVLLHLQGKPFSRGAAPPSAGKRFPLSIRNSAGVGVWTSADLVELSRWAFSRAERVT